MIQFIKNNEPPRALDRILILMDNFKEIWNSYYPKLMLYGSSFSGLTESDREDCLQEIFVTLHEQQRTYNARWALSTWLYRIARNKFIDYQRVSKRTGHIKSLEGSEEKIGSSDPGLSPELRMDIEAAIGRMDDRDRELLHLYYYEERSVAEIARILGIPKGTVKSRLFRVRSILKNQLEGCHVAE